MDCLTGFVEITEELKNSYLENPIKSIIKEKSYIPGEGTIGF
jgi:hypothetical protein